MVDHREVFVYTDQPTTCPVCGARTEIIMDLGHTKEATQVYMCLDEKCGSTFACEK